MIRSATRIHIRRCRRRCAGDKRTGIGNTCIRCCPAASGRRKSPVRLHPRGHQRVGDVPPRWASSAPIRLTVSTAATALAALATTATLAGIA